MAYSAWGWGEGRAGTHTTLPEVIRKRRESKLPLSANGRTQDNWPDLHQRDVFKSKSRNLFYGSFLGTGSTKGKVNAAPE